jgi:hypothetical protein
MSPTLYRSVVTWIALCVAAGLLAYSIRAADSGDAKPIVPEPANRNAAADKLPPRKFANSVGSDVRQPEPLDNTAIHAALDKPVSLDFKATPLKDVVAKIETLTGINVLLDLGELKEIEITPKTEIDFSCDRVPLRLALRQLLYDHELDYEIDFEVATDNTLLITTAKKVQDHLVVRVYDAHDLVRLSRDPYHEDNEPNLDEVINAITNAVDPRTWTESGGSGSIAPWNGALVVSQTENAQIQIADLLAALRHSARQADFEPIVLGSPETTAEEEANIAKALIARHDFAFVNTPFREFEDSLHKLGLRGYSLSLSIQESNVLPETPVNFKAKRIRIGDALHLILDGLDLGYYIDHGEVVIVSKANADDHVTSRVYPVGDLIAARGPALCSDDDLYDELIDAITHGIAPKSWTASGGAGSVQPIPSAKALVLSQNWEGHAACAKLLADLRARPHSAPQPAPDPQEIIVRSYPLSSTPKSIAQCMATIRGVIEPKSWNAEGVYLGELNGTIILRQTRAVQAQVKAFLKSQNLTTDHQSATGAAPGDPVSAPAAANPLATTFSAATSNAAGASPAKKPNP